MAAGMRRTVWLGGGALRNRENERRRRAPSWLLWSRCATSHHNSRRASVGRHDDGDCDDDDEDDDDDVDVHADVDHV